MKKTDRHSVVSVTPHQPYYPAKRILQDSRMATQTQGDHGDRDDNGGSPRPSFAKLWKRSKAKLAQRRNITFVSAKPGAPNGAYTCVSQ